MDDSNWTVAYAHSLTNAELAEILEYGAFYHAAEIAAAAMREAAKRLKEEPEAHFVMPPAPNHPPLKAYAALEAGAVQR
jgi:hypothetical protein